MDIKTLMRSTQGLEAEGEAPGRPAPAAAAASPPASLTPGAPNPPMVPALGRALILLALFAASAGALVGFVTGARPSVLGWRFTRGLAYAFAAFMTAANLLMVYALLARDFTVSYVTQVGSRAVPDWVAVTSLWSSLEGSILFWGLVMAAYIAGALYDDQATAIPSTCPTPPRCGSAAPPSSASSSRAPRSPSSPCPTLRPTARGRTRSCRTTS